MLLTLALLLAALLLYCWLQPSEALRYLLHLILRVLVKRRVVGELPKTGPAVLAANHVSFIDAFLLGSATDRWVRWLLWKPYYENKTFQPIAKLLYCLPMAQEGLREIIANLNAAREVLKQGEMIGIFPEGEISRTGKMTEFRRGYEKVLQGTEGVLVPVFLGGLWGHPLSPNPGKWWPFRRPEAWVVIGEPLPPNTPPEVLQAKVMELGARAGEPNGQYARHWHQEPAAGGGQ